jgi:hypothetical protein
MGGKTIVSGMPRQSKTATEAQKAQRRHFQQAALYSKAALESPELGEAYRAEAKKRGRAPYIVAVADFLLLNISTCRATTVRWATSSAFACSMTSKPGGYM